MTDDAISKVSGWFDQISDNESFAGVSGLRCDVNMQLIGGVPNFDGDYVDCTNLQRYLYNLLDDKAEVYKTSVLKRYPFPEFDGEKFVPEPVVWEHIARDGYMIRWYKEIVYVCEYLEDGLTASSHKNSWKILKGFLHILQYWKL